MRTAILAPCNSLQRAAALDPVSHQQKPRVQQFPIPRSFYSMPLVALCLEASRRSELVREPSALAFSLPALPLKVYRRCGRSGVIPVLLYTNHMCETIRGARSPPHKFFPTERLHSQILIAEQGSTCRYVRVQQPIANRQHWSQQDSPPRLETQPPHSAAWLKAAGRKAT
jgi:hypothetical protein